MFESVNYSFLLQDFLFTLAVGFAGGFINQLVSVFIYKGKIRLFIKDIFICTLFAVVLFSYVVSFANYPVVRFYHIIGAFTGFLSFNIRFSIFFQKISEKIFSFIKRKILCSFEKIKSVFCDLCRKKRQKWDETPKTEEKADLKTEDILVYNL